MNLTFKNLYIQILLRAILFIAITLISINIFYSYTTPIEFEKKEILSILISSISIIIAIIITYLFSKLFTEKTERIQRKSEIDFLSHKITSFRKLAFQIKNFNQFWRFGEKDVKQIIERKYSNLKYGDIAENKLKYENLKIIISDVGERALQGYLGIKGLENNENTFKFYQTFTPTNYSLEEIQRFEEYTYVFWVMLDKSSKEIVNLNKENSESLKMLDDLFNEITNREIDKENYNKEIQNIFEEFRSEIFPKHHYLTRLNTVKIPELFLSSLINILIFIVLLFSSLFLFVVNLNPNTEYVLSLLIVSLFVANTVDILIMITSAIYYELNIKEFYKF